MANRNGARRSRKGGSDASGTRCGAQLQGITPDQRKQDVLRHGDSQPERRVRERTTQLTDDGNFMSAVLETAPALIVVLDSCCRIIRCSNAAEKLSGRSFEDIAGRSIWDIGLIPAEEADTVRDVFARVAAGHPPIRHEHHWQSADGSRHLIAWTTAPLRKSDGGIDFFVKAGVDITDQRRAETEARAHQATLLHAHRTIAAGELAAALAHEVNQPLTAVANLCEATLQQLPDANLPAGVVKNLRAIAAQVLRAGNVIRDLRAFVARRDVHRSVVDINALVSAAQGLIGPEATRNGIRIDLDLAPRQMIAHVAAIHVEHALINLLQNAIDAIAHHGTAHGRVTVKTFAGTADTIEVAISDNGPGFGTDDREQAFDPFFTTKACGLGLGLAIARSVIEANGGRLWLDSTGKKGSTLRFSLPCAT